MFYLVVIFQIETSKTENYLLEQWRVQEVCCFVPRNKFPYSLAAKASAKTWTGFNSQLQIQILVPHTLPEEKKNPNPRMTGVGFVICLFVFLLQSDHLGLNPELVSAFLTCFYHEQQVRWAQVIRQIKFKHVRIAAKKAARKVGLSTEFKCSAAFSCAHYALSSFTSFTLPVRTTVMHYLQL